MLCMDSSIMVSSCNVFCMANLCKHSILVVEVQRIGFHHFITVQSGFNTVYYRFDSKDWTHIESWRDVLRHVGNNMVWYSLTNQCNSGGISKKCHWPDNARCTFRRIFFSIFYILHIVVNIRVNYPLPSFRIHFSLFGHWA